ncbi:MAG TPA: hypothetical protein VKX40_16405 [Aequorivita sp.]|nr:hypothetical protein [Aequorivita sp.]
MEKYIILFCLLILIGCSGTPDTANLEEVAYLLNSEIEQDNKALVVIIEDKEKRLNTDSIYDKFKLQTQGHIDFLEALIDLSVKNEINPFFENEELTASARTYRKMSFEYNALVTKLYPEMKILVKDLLNLNDIWIEENLYFDYVYYHFGGMPKEMVIFKLEKRKEKVLMLQNEVLFWILAEQCNNH